MPQVRPVLDDDDKPSPRPVAFPLSPPDESARNIFNEADGRASMRGMSREPEGEPTFQNIDKARRALTTVASPYLRAVRRETR